MATSTDEAASTTNGNIRYLRLTGTRSGGTITWKIEFKSLYTLSYNNLVCDRYNLTTSDVTFNYSGTNVWKTVVTWTTSISQGQSKTQKAKVTVPAVGSTSQTVNDVSVTVEWPADVPDAPGKPTFSNDTPTSVTVTIPASADDNGAAIDWYLLRYWPNAEGTGAYVNHSTSMSLTRNVTGLTPGNSYRFVAYAHNSEGYSSASAAAVIQLIAAIWVKVAGIWKLAVPYVKMSGVWKAAAPYVKVSGVWKRTE